jgi:hypothetical protein
MNEIAMHRPAFAGAALRRKVSLPSFSALLDRVRSGISPEERRERLIRAVERDRVLSELHQSANVALMSAYLDPLYMPFAHN